MNYRINDKLCFISLSPGDEINSSFEKIAIDVGIKAAWISGIGALTNIEMGYYDIENKTYIKKYYNDEYELTSLSGNISIKDNRIYSHTHITFSDKNFNVFGGHLFNGIISAAGEFLMTIGDKPINRKFNDQIGLALWCIK